MLRASFKSSIAITAVQSRINVQPKFARPLSVPGIRFNSSLTQEQRRANNKVKKEMQKDWSAPILTYESVKQKSQQPSEVCVVLAISQLAPRIRFRMRI
jgi:thiosulfate:glutathione sulfurtransferase